MDGIGLDAAQLVAIFLESMFFGMFFILYCIVLWILSHKRTSRRANIVMMSTVTTMFVLAIVHLAIDLSRIMDAFIGQKNVQDGALLYYANLSNPKQVAKTVVYATQTIIGDSFVVYRTWVVWNRNLWVIIFPALCIVGNAVTGYGVSYELAQVVPGADIFLSTLQPWITSFFSLTFCTNVICTALIAGRLWWRERSIGHAAQMSFLPVVAVVVESGAIYSAALISLLVVYLSGSNGQYPALDLVNPLIGVTFSLILVRIGLGISNNGTTASGVSSYQRATGRGQAPWKSGMNANPATGTAQYPMKPLAINVKRLVEHDGDSGEPVDVSGNSKAGTYGFDGDLA
ncbi:hypothetical protein GLOTRDRAFT_127087 [Gloeophyllum trabeum ATCC 11539]|uniref:Family A G protein-coupled receptor-like protein n=1 Tax=Gloeophyllum trabeum (strain ATCC 11539 / FP-39264 / Madison 617) TaxID=670483 RepID=S7RV05_GLOTA|nr:uncharacterized protein GLOTRDRAFT_127087 [Gloeophyllum trabeum ATCC 11539]EPQ58590.1 hypothetical protein GLOTRDRAFT_127087 [Gloeophyllum trabeum ATCC 11539]